VSGDKLKADSTITDHDGPIEATCNRFESSWKAGEEPKLEDFLCDWEEPERSKLLSELLLLELEYVGSDGRTLAPQEYVSRFPEHDDVIRDVFDRWIGSRKSDTQVSADTLVMQSKLGELRLHSQGGLGLIFRADDQRLSREVAVKFIRPTLADDPESRERFCLEAEITSRLEHPGVVPVYGLGTAEDNRLFYAMRFIQGETLDEAIDRYHAAKKKGEMGRTDRERLFRSLLVHFIAMCKTIAYAHNRGIVHRDIKPANVMLGRYGETIVIDWGLAMPVGRRGVFRDPGEQTLMPGSGSSSSGQGWGGTPVFMSPEQAAGSLDLTPASDIYSLGVTLYKILVGDVPFRGTLDQVRSDIIRGVFKKPSDVKKSASKTLEAICLKAMATDIPNRYETALALASDAENYLGDSPVSAYREPVSRRLARWSRRHRSLSQAVLVGLLLLTLAGASSAWVFGWLRSEAMVAQQREHEQRRSSLAVSARFAARTIADKIDIRLRLLERAADDPRLQAYISQANSDSQNEEARRPLQQWLDALAEKHPHIESRALFVCASDGAQVARNPMLQEDGKPYGSLQQNYNYRDYFHGQGDDFVKGPPLDESHVSVAMESTNDGFLGVVFSAPIRPLGETSALGVLGMTIELGQFADLSIPLPPGQKVVLVDTRKYYLKPLDPARERGDRGEGLILHHEDLGDLRGRTRLPHLDNATLEHLLDQTVEGPVMQNLLPAGYRDPVAADDDRSWLAAFAPLQLTARPADSEVRHTGWFVIVQQQQETSE
jgi:serine/threonine-protein kinase